VQVDEESLVLGRAVATRCSGYPGPGLFAKTPRRRLPGNSFGPWIVYRMRISA